MAFTGLATYADTSLVDIERDVSPIVAMLAQYTTPILDALGDPAYAAVSDKHEWIEDALNAVSGNVSVTATQSVTGIEVQQIARWVVGDIIQPRGKQELMLVTSLGTNSLVVTRAYAGTTADSISVGGIIDLVGNAALEGADMPADRSTTRTRVTNWSQIFTAGIEVSGTRMAVNAIGVANELQNQTTNRTREKLRELERTLLYGGAPATTTQGSSTVRRSTMGLRGFLTTNAVAGGGSITLTETVVNSIMQTHFANGSQTTHILVGADMQRKFSTFVTPSSRYYKPEDSKFSAYFGAYQGDFGIQRVVMSPNVHPGDVFFVDMNRIKVIPLQGRSFQVKPIAETGDSIKKELFGEYVIEVQNQTAHSRLYDMA